VDKIFMRHIKGACPKQRALFRKTFPEGAPISIESAEKALAAGLDVRWLIRLLPQSARAEYNRTVAPAETELDRTKAAAWAERERTVAAAWAEYERAKADAWAEYDSAMAPARAELDRAAAAAWAEYNRTLAAARAEYDRTVAAALVAALLTVKEHVPDSGD
jgi:hypothetical protein